MFHAASYAFNHILSKWLSILASQILYTGGTEVHSELLKG